MTSTPGTVLFPTALDDNDSLIRVANNATTTTTDSGGTGANSTGGTTFNVVSTTSFPASGVLSVDNEIVTYTGKTSTAFTGITRGQDGTIAAVHANGATITGNIVALDHMVLANAIIQAETKIGSGSSTPVANAVLQGTGTGTSAWNTKVGLNRTPESAAWLSLYSTDAVFPTHRVDATGGTIPPGYASDALDAFYAPTGMSGGLTVLGTGFAGMKQNIYVGYTYADFLAYGYDPAMHPTAAVASVDGYDCVMYIAAVNDTVNTPHALNEHCPYVSNMRYDMTSGDTGRTWLTDFVAHSAIGRQHSGFSGIHSTPRWFYNGSPYGSQGPQNTGHSAFDPTGNFMTTITAEGSAGFVATTGYGALGLIDSSDAHNGVSTYPMNVGVAVVGSSGDSTGNHMQRQGWQVGFMAGGVAGNYGSSVPFDSNGKGSRIGIGFFSRDDEKIGFYAYKQYDTSGGTALSFVSDSEAGNALFRTTQNTPTSANAHSYVTINDDLRDTTNQGKELSVNGGDLSTSSGTLHKIASFGVGDTNPSAMMLNVVARRNAASAGYASTAFGLSFEHDAAGTRDNGYWMTSKGHGFGLSNTDPQAMVDVAGVTTSVAVGLFNAPSGQTADIFSVQLNSANKINVNGGGQVGIGGSADSSYALKVSGTMLVTGRLTGNGQFVEVIASTTDMGLRANNQASGGRDYVLYSSASATTLVNGLNFYDNTATANRMSISATGAVAVPGSFTVTGAKMFAIDHPLDPTEYDLYHSSVEAPQADLIYRGTVALENGTATVDLDTAARMRDGTFAALCTNVQCFTTNEDGWDAVRASVSGATLTIECQNPTSADTVSWLVIGERHDPSMTNAANEFTDAGGRLIVESRKPEPPAGMLAYGHRGYYRDPIAYGVALLPPPEIAAS